MEPLPRAPTDLARRAVHRSSLPASSFSDSDDRRGHVPHHLRKKSIGDHPQLVSPFSVPLGASPPDTSHGCQEHVRPFVPALLPQLTGCAPGQQTTRNVAGQPIDAQAASPSFPSIDPLRHQTYRRSRAGGAAATWMRVPVFSPDRIEPRVKTAPRTRCRHAKRPGPEALPR